MRAWEDERDDAWLVQMADGDRTALAEVLSTYGSVVLALVESIIGPSSEAEEVVQEVFLSLWRQAPSWGSHAPAPLGVWLLSHARKRALAELHQAPELASFGRDVSLLGERTSNRPAFGLPPRGAAPLYVGRMRARRALSNMRPSARRLLSLVLLRGLTPAALGRITGQPTRKARRLLMHAVRSARDTLRSRQESFL